MTRPHPMGDAREHLMLMRTMAAQTGADTVLAFDEGTLDAQSWAEAVTRCRNCAWAEGCKAWLAQAYEGRRDVPKTCENADLMQDLRLPGA
ncbi:hypothetical protein JANAI62_06700 [Jannaschia pagri]|uniref:DUF6455 domain-containing protein n=1 Tax=Jannaschia pagri TaxID=2829797 RepID=A0ABQ4NIW3_9RHOB|nr:MULTISPECIES: DUF6455 family protein [unclassified Jannaschia]GIT89846.1 hypothetical protein JANAI61_03040 [Jannaschia sp. AI_61]GIT94047.1 hypothetical protein JANAI62_06700 [Jannaschia sp. AI_62]